eukprot:SAG31_NODE_2904_length_4928_cov_3.585007_4_plen_40_part_00
MRGQLSDQDAMKNSERPSEASYAALNFYIRILMPDIDPD